VNADTRHPHLDLEDLIAEAAGQPIGDRARAHLAGCERCQLEAKRWNLVAEGVRGLAAAAPAAGPAPSVADAAEAARPARPRLVRPHVPAGPWRRVMLVAGGVAAALVLLVGIGAATGYVHISRPGTEAALTAVTGCTELEQADGTLARVNGSSLVIETASGQPVTVTTTASTFMTVSGPLLGDITDGASVVVRGYRSGGTIAAAIVTVGQPFSAVNPVGFVPVEGTVTDATTTGFTLVAAGGTRIRVTTSGDTLVIVPHARLGELPAGAAIAAVGLAGPGQTLAAQGVAAIIQLGPGKPHLSVSLKGCSPSSITAALAAISVAPAAAG
jgi:hypothetical protein